MRAGVSSACSSRRARKSGEGRHCLITLGADLLFDDRHREQGLEVGRADRLSGAGMEHRRRRLGQVGDDVVPLGRYVLLAEEILDLIGHVVPPCAAQGDVFSRAPLPVKANPILHRGALIF
jgi:hypothetical protein